MQGTTLLSTVVAPRFGTGTLYLLEIPAEKLPGYLAEVTRNLCGHPVTDGVLRAVCPSLPAPERAFWDGADPGLAVRPRGGVRGAQANGDTQVAGLEQVEAVLVTWVPAP